MDNYRSSMVTGAEAGNKVYINPNFKGSQKPPTQLHNSSMHINPKFSQQLCNRQPLSESNSVRIFINPNFIRTKLTPNIEAKSQNIVMEAAATTSYSYLNSQGLTTQNPQVQTIAKPVTTNHQSLPVSVAPITKSRYSIVRQNIVPQTKVIKPETASKTTYKISKYKSTTMQNIKKNLNSQYINDLKRPLKFTPAVYTNSKISSPSCSSRYNLVKSKGQNVSSRYKIIKAGTSSMALSTPKKVAVSSKQPLARNTPRSMRATIEGNKKIFKKNNIPCPLYRKYGKCLRNGKGACEFLHDKKHVAICRKFLKGICHDKECLLSHEISKEKMPTCSFYLRGMCTKEDCPYLHVKLNENTQICSDFLKGYCNKGDECLRRHINVCPDLAAKGVCHKKKCPYPHKENRNNTRTKIYRKLTKTSTVVAVATMSQQPKGNDKNDSNDNNHPDCRYYKEVVNGDDNTSTDTEVIKPTRCKLGNLPSFIQL